MVKCQVHNPDVEYFEEPGEAHDAIIMDKIFSKDKCSSEHFINGWIMANVMK